MRIIWIIWAKWPIQNRLAYGFQERIWISIRCRVTLKMWSKVTNSLSVWQPEKHSKTRSLVLWRNVMAWGFFYTLSSCNTPKRKTSKRPKSPVILRVCGLFGEVPRMSVRKKVTSPKMMREMMDRPWSNDRKRTVRRFSENVILVR